TIAEARTIYDEARLSDDPTMIRLVGAAVHQRLAALADADRGKAISATRDASIAFGQEHAAWEREHPSPTQRLAAIERERGTAAILFDASAQFAMDVYDISRKPVAPTLRPTPDVVPSGGELRVGPGFDAIAAGRK